MSDRRDEDEAMPAAELALGVLAGEELRLAQARLAQDAAFRAEHDAWLERLQPLADALPETAPPPHVWDGIARRLTPRAANDNAQALGRQLRRWRVYGIGVSALAASLAAVVGINLARAPEAVAPVAQAPQILMATLASDAVPNSVAVAYDRRDSSLLVTPGRWPTDATHDHQLWIIPPGGAPVPLGVCCQRGVERHSVPVALAPHFRERSVIAVSVEPLGGNRTGRPSSDFAVQGQLLPI